VKISDSTRSMRKKSSYALFCGVLIAGFLLLTISGCGRQKEELDSAKQQIEKLNSELKRLNETAAGLNREKSSLSDDFKALSDKNTQIQSQLDDVNKAKAALSAQSQEIGKKNSKAEEEISSLKRENASLAQEIEDMKKRVAQLEPRAPQIPPEALKAEDPGARQPKELSPCDAVIAFMKASEAIVRQQKGPQRAELLEQVKKQYEPRMKGAPQKAIKAAEDWVKEGSKFWDQTHGEGGYRLLRLRNTALESCGKSPGEAGF
jgi:chromosome segregation ATPase